MSEATSGPPPPADHRGPFSELVTALAGPALIVASVLAVLHRFAFSGLLSSTHPDVPSLWLPTYCLLGRTLRQGHILGWNPFTMGGVPFAADPQSGWLYLPAMALFTALPCGAAIEGMILFQPVLAGLGVYWFSRSEDLSRPAATVGGLVLSLGIAGSALSVSLPIGGMLAWTAVLLAAASRFVHARSWSGRLTWSLVMAGAWGQLVAAFLSDGVLLGTSALALYLIVAGIASVRMGRWRWREALGGIGLLAVMLPALNVAYLLPRLIYLRGTSLSLGYGTLQEIGVRLAGQAAQPFEVGPGTGLTWPLNFAASPGAHLGAIALALALAGWWLGGRRHLAGAFTIYGAGGFVLGVSAVARATPASLRSFAPMDSYLHFPQRLSYALLPAMALLAALGVQAWASAGSWRSRALMTAPGIAVWGVLPAALGAGGAKLFLVMLGAVAGGASLLAAARRPVLLVLVPVVVAAELVTNGLLPEAAQPFGGEPSQLEPVPRPDTPARSYLSPGPIAAALGAATRRAGPGLGGSLADPDVRYTSVGGVGDQLREALVPGSGFLNQAMLFGIQNAGGYNSVQPQRFWVFTRSLDQEPALYNVAILTNPPPAALDLLQIGYVVTPSGRPPPGMVPAMPEPVATQGVWALWKLAAPPRAEVIGAWTVVAPGGPDPTGSPALLGVRAPGFDPHSIAILERPVPAWVSSRASDGTSSPAEGVVSGASATFHRLGPQAARIDVSAPGPSIVIVRAGWDSNWHAVLDGRPVRLLRADYLIQAVAVSGGHHVISLTYDDPWIGFGLGGSALVVALVVGAVWVLRRAERRRGRLGPSAGAGAGTGAGTETPI
jgi:hypothetical protein